MKPHVLFAALALALVACSSGGEGGTASIPFDPFGTEPAPTSGAEPTGGDSAAPPRGASLEDLCAQLCVRFASSCSGAGYCNPADCVTIGAGRPDCVGSFRAYLSCLVAAPIECGPYGAEVPACDNAGQTAQTCLGYRSPE
jgi:hypothetical protein